MIAMRLFDVLATDCPNCGPRRTAKLSCRVRPKVQCPDCRKVLLPEQWTTLGQLKAEDRRSAVEAWDSGGGNSL